ncbi:maleylpyruvate isomerase family mycothiol-dependent enzyme [[Pseudopropionibacterium] massiliense]|uniref:maleylpyruvate isomerase family mycothiol-dependent enzyme n=1 Tax=[Pseudopropionibacterium] massiliense TaxID=2220000 RepID=UPI0010300892
MTAELRNAQRDEFCRVLSMVAPDAPTLCSGWTAFDLAAHIWILNHGPRAWAGMLLPPLSWLTDREIQRTKERFSYAGLVEEIRTGPASFACMPTDPREEHRHSLGEYFIHTEDVRRPRVLRVHADRSPGGAPALPRRVLHPHRGRAPPESAAQTGDLPRPGRGPVEAPQDGLPAAAPVRLLGVPHPAGRAREDRARSRHQTDHGRTR